MNRRKIPDSHLHQAAPILQLVVQTPAFRAAQLWIETSRPEKARNGYPTSVGMICFAMEYTWGAVVDKRTMALALETAGFRIAARCFIPSGGWGNRELAVNVRLGSINQTPWKTEEPKPERWAWVNAAAPVPGIETLYRNVLKPH